MKQFLAILLAAAFSAMSYSAVAQDKMDKSEKMEKKADKKAAKKAPKKAAKKAAKKSEMEKK
jgi:hypothetical protein